MKKSILLPLMPFWAIAAMGQSVTGKVVNAQGEALPYANVFLLTPKDSTFIKGTISDAAGVFSVDGYSQGDILKVSAMGYKTSYLTCQSDSVGIIAMQEDSKLLGKVVVKGHHNYVKSSNMGLTVSMIDNPLSKLGSALDAIKQMPLISGIGNNISVLGKGTPEIYINHRKVRDNSELQQLSSQNIQSVEIITNPGAKYEADVKSVIIIHTKKQDLGWAGLARFTGVLSGVSYGIGGLDLSWSGRQGLTLYGSGNLGGSGYKQSGYYLEDFNSGQYQTRTDGTYKRSSQNLKATFGGSYDFGSNSVGIRYEFSRTPHNKYTSTNDIMTNVDSNYSNLESTSEESTQSSRHYINSYGSFKFGAKKNYELTTNVDYLYNITGTSSQIGEHDQQYQNDITTDSHGNNHLFAAKANWNASWKNVCLDLGVQYSYTKTHQTFGGNATAEKNFFDASYDEEKQHLTAGYVAANWQISKNWSARTELRMENTDFTYLLNDKKIEEQSKTFCDWLPYLSLDYQKGNFGLDISYSTTVDRPSYSMLSNNYSYTSHTSWYAGNPLLKSALERTLELVTSYRKTRLSVSYTHSMRELTTIYYYQEDLKANVGTVVNLPSYNYFQFSLYQRLDVGIWHPSVYGMLKVQKLEYGNPEMSYNKPRLRVIMRNRFDLPWGIYAYFDGMWIGKGYSSTIYTKNDVLLDMGLNKSLGNWSFTIYWNDCFKLWRQEDQVRTNGVSFYQHFKGGTHNVSLNVTYSFNKKKNYRGKSAAQDEINRL